MEKKRVDQSEELLQHALAVDDSIEPIYQKLIGLLHGQGRFAEVQLVFNLCQHVLSNLGIGPTEATRSLFTKRQGKQSSEIKKVHRP